MTIEQTVTITDDHWLHFELPLDLPLGRARVELTVTPERAHSAKAADEWVNPLRGRAKALGLQLSPERVLEMQREDVELENAIDERLRRRGYCCSSGFAERMAIEQTVEIPADRLPAAFQQIGKGIYLCGACPQTRGGLSGGD